jgi:hypothetical protein
MSNRDDLVQLNLDDDNELIFKVIVEGTSSEPAKVRLVCDAVKTSYMFNGKPTDDGHVRFLVPMLEGIEEGEVCNGRIEVLVENRFFVPVQFDIEFRRRYKVIPESLVVKRAPEPNLKVSASQVNYASPMTIIQQEQKSVVKKIVEEEKREPEKAAKKLEEHPEHKSEKKKIIEDKIPVIEKKVVKSASVVVPVVRPLEKSVQIEEVKKAVSASPVKIKETIKKEPEKKTVESKVSPKVIPEIKKVSITKPVKKIKESTEILTETGIDEATMRDVLSSITSKLKDIF